MHPHRDAPSTPCDPLRLESFLGGRCDEAESSAIEQHLDACENCRTLIEQQAADEPFWGMAADRLDTRDEIDAESTKLSTLEWFGLQSSSEPAHEIGLDRYLGNWLQPSSASELSSASADSLGRLGKYEVILLIGTGGMGMVLSGHDPALKRDVAIKTLRPHLTSCETSRKRFAREAQLAASLRHPGVIPIFDVDQCGGVPYFVMPLIELGGLDQRFRQTAASLDEVLEVGRQIALGLSAAHQQGMIHRDIKPSNVLLLDGLDHIVIADFGLARTLDQESLTLTGMMAGTPQFMSPEQARGDSASTASDLFSLGSVLYWMATSRLPFNAETHYGTLSKIITQDADAPSDIDDRLPFWFDRLIKKMMAKSPSDRPWDAGQLANLLERVQQHHADPKANPLPVELAGDVKRSSNHWKWITAAVVAILVGLGSFWLAQPGRQAAPSDFSSTESQPASLDPTRLRSDLQSGTNVAEWLKHLNQLPVNETPIEAIPLIESFADSSDQAIRTEARRWLDRNPFEVVALEDENPFVPID